MPEPGTDATRRQPGRGAGHGRHVENDADEQRPPGPDTDARQREPDDERQRAGDQHACRPPPARAPFPPSGSTSRRFKSGTLTPGHRPGGPDTGSAGPRSCPVALWPERRSVGQRTAERRAADGGTEGSAAQGSAPALARALRVPLAAAMPPAEGGGAAAGVPSRGRARAGAEPSNSVRGGGPAALTFRHCVS